MHQSIPSTAPATYTSLNKLIPSPPSISTHKLCLPPSSPSRSHSISAPQQESLFSQLPLIDDRLLLLLQPTPYIHHLSNHSAQLPTPTDLPSTDILDPDPDARVRAYAKLEFPHHDFFIRKLAITLGRRPPLTPPSAYPNPDTEPPLDLDLGPIRAVSRCHARIYFDWTSARWSIEVLGRNGCVVDGRWKAKSETVPLRSRTKIQIAERIFYFILPDPDPPPLPPDPQIHNPELSVPAPAVEPEQTLVDEPELVDKSYKEMGLDFGSGDDADDEPEPQACVQGADECAGPDETGPPSPPAPPAPQSPPALPLVNHHHDDDDDEDSSSDAHPSSSSPRPRSVASSGLGHSDDEPRPPSPPPRPSAGYHTQERVEFELLRSASESDSMDDEVMLSSETAHQPMPRKMPASKAPKKAPAGAGKGGGKRPQKTGGKTKGPETGGKEKEPVGGERRAEVVVKERRKIVCVTPAGAEVGSPTQKPPYTYASLIAQALAAQKDEDGKLLVSEICEWMAGVYPFYGTKEKGTDWQSAVRHNLNADKRFKKIDRQPHDGGKGNFWTLREEEWVNFDGLELRRPNRECKTGRAGGQRAGASLGTVARRDVSTHHRTQAVPCAAPPRTPERRGGLRPPPPTPVPDLPVFAPLTPPPEVGCAREPSPPEPLWMAEPEMSPEPVATSAGQTQMDGAIHPALLAAAPPVPPIPAPAPGPTMTAPGPFKIIIQESPTSLLSTATRSSLSQEQMVNLITSDPPMYTSGSNLVLNKQVFGELKEEQVLGLEKLGGDVAVGILEKFIVEWFKERCFSGGGGGSGKKKKKKKRKNNEQQQEEEGGNSCGINNKKRKIGDDDENGGQDR